MAPNGVQFIAFYSRKELYSEIILNSFSVAADIVERTVEPCKDLRESLFSIHFSETHCTVPFKVWRFFRSSVMGLYST